MGSIASQPPFCYTQLNGKNQYLKVLLLRMLKSIVNKTEKVYSPSDFYCITFLLVLNRDREERFFEGVRVFESRKQDVSL